MTRKSKVASSKATTLSTRKFSQNTSDDSSSHITIKPEDRFELDANGTFRIGGKTSEFIFKLVNEQTSEGAKSYVVLEQPKGGATLIANDQPPIGVAEWAVRIATSGTPINAQRFANFSAAEWAKRFASSGAEDWVVQFAPGSGLSPRNRATLFRGVQGVRELELAMPNLVKMHGVAAKRYGTKPDVVIALNDKPAAREMASAKSKLLARGLEAKLIIGKKI